MALALHAVEALAPYLKGARVLGLGYPDILASEEDVERIFGVKVLRTIDAGSQHGITRPLVETMELMRLLGSTLECVDVKAWRGFERVLDLNEPHDLGAFDLVIDPGTSEHCFNVGQAIMNGAKAVKPGGRIWHSLPFTMVNHGFYNVCPTALWDFYMQNGWTIDLYEVRNKNGAVALDERGAHARSAKTTSECGIICMARRLTDAALRWPTQHKYLVMAAMKAAA